MNPAMATLPIVYAYGRRWKREHLELLPEFEAVSFSGLYILYSDTGVPFYTGISEDIPKRLASDHSKGRISDKWNSFSWFIIDPEFHLHDIEALCIKGFSLLEYGAIRGKTRCHTEILGWNVDPSGIRREDSVWRNYWVREADEGATLEAYNSESRSVLAVDARQRCRLKHGAAVARHGDRVSAEKIVLGCALIEPTVLETAVSLLEEHHFSVPAHRAIFHAMRALRAAGRPIDIIVVAEFLRKMKQLSIAGGSAAVANLIDVAVEHAPIEYYVKIIKGIDAFDA
jgi:hypothetical protein